NKNMNKHLLPFVALVAVLQAVMTQAHAQSDGDSQTPTLSGCNKACDDNRYDLMADYTQQATAVTNAVKAIRLYPQKIYDKWDDLSDNFPGEAGTGTACLKHRDTVKKDLEL